MLFNGEINKQYHQEVGIMRIFLFLLSFFFLTGGVSLAGNIASGKTKSLLCEKCHGADGNSSESPAVPKLAGQQSVYFIQEIKEFKSGNRKNPLMEPIAAGLSDPDIDDLSAYYASLKPSAEKVDSALSSKGKGNYNLCGSCHGPTATGQGPIPRLAGQHAAYLFTQLKAYKDGGRKNPVMNGVTMSLSEGDFKGLAEYAAGLK
jgi:cytochrome c553